MSEEFSAERSRIHFFGFLDCEDSPDADVIIFHNKNSPLLTFFLGGVHGLAFMGPNPNAAEYDPDSVMNYGKIQGKGGIKAGLSPKDAELLKSLYP